ncbi:MAG: hypothetical protein B7Z80_18475 [Rhodospirillales bacterium 20-64-7]|nr:MAG: hypothetical protein B7Z80_18475 [Rhodospirillales bacterium 20-64-7]HQT76899.1 sulfite exporter TauE/SafE family protein [Rhodopila sp.]
MIGVFGAALLRGFTGFGFGLAAVPLLSLSLPPSAVVPLVVTLQVAVGLFGLRHAIGECDWQSVRRLFPGLPLGVPIGLAVLTILPANPVRLVIGTLIATAVWLIYRGVSLPPNPSRKVSFAVGLTSGIISGLASMGGPPIVVYLLAVGHSAGRMRATAVVYFMLAGLVSMLPMAARGMINQQTLLWTAASIPALLGGTRLGSWAFFRSKPAHHRLAALVSLSVLSALLIGRAALGFGG